MIKKRKISTTFRIFFVIGLLIALVGSLFYGYIYISNLISDIRSGTQEEITNDLVTIEGLLLILLFLTLSFVIILGKLLYDLSVINRENYFIVEIGKMTSKIDQQTTIEKLDLYNDRLVKFVGNFTHGVRNSKMIYRSLFQTYMIKSMKTEHDFEKIKMYTTILIKAYAESYNMTEIYNSRRIATIADASVMYDIGKLGTPGYVLYKEANLNADDFEMAKRHANVGYDLIKAICPEKRQGSFEQYLQDIAGYHHERYDGTGYPWGVKGEEIPFIARVIALVTTYDTITRDRPYRKAMTHEEAVLLINNEKGKYFDPKIVKIFNAIEKEFNKIRSMN